MAERARQAAPSAEVRVGDAASLDVEDGSFDVVLSAFSVFFMPDPTAALSEWRRALAPAGRIVLSTWAAGDPRWEFERQIRRGYLGEFEPAVLQELGKGLALLERFDDAQKVATELGAAGFTVTAQTQHEIEFFFGDEQAWWEWNWSHGSRVFLEPLSEEARSRFRSEVGHAMQQIRGEGGFPRTYTAVFSRADA
jgi:SAM-dependent methyltransferase